MKEYINQETFYNILLNSNSKYAKKFKNEVAKILDKLTSQGNIKVIHDELTLVENKEPLKILRKPIEILNEEYIYTQTYENRELVNMAKEIISQFKKTNWNKYANKHVLYMFIITLEDPEGLSRILCKLGYSCDFITRIKGLEGEYKCKFYLIGLKIIHNIQDEKKFHLLLRQKFPELLVDLKINNQDKDECYVFDMDLYKTFLDYVDKEEFNTTEIELEEENKEILKEYFENIEKRYERELMLKMKPIIKISEITTNEQKEYAINLNNNYYELLLLQEQTNCKIQMKNKDIEIEKIKKEKDIEIELIKREKDIKIEEIKKEKDIEIEKIKKEHYKLCNLTYGGSKTVTIDKIYCGINEYK